MSSLTVLVTGASEGIGFALTKRLEAAGYTVIGCARNVAPIEVNAHLLYDLTVLEESYC